MPSKSATKQTLNLLQQSNVYEGHLPNLAQAHRDGDEAALYDAIVLIDALGRHKKDEYLVSDWVWKGLVASYENSIRRRVPTGRGQGGNPPKRYESNQIHCVRYLVAKRHVDEGKTVEQASELAHGELKGKPARGSADAIRKSYYRVRRAVTEGGRKNSRFRTASMDAHELLSDR